MFATVDMKVEFRILQQQSLPKSPSQLKLVPLLISLHSHTYSPNSLLLKKSLQKEVCLPASLGINKLTLHKVQEEKEGMFSTYVTASLHATSYLGGRLLVHSEAGE